MTERDNAARLAPPPETLSPANTDNSDDIFNLPVPTEIVLIPSRGEYYPEGSPFKGQAELEVKFMTATEEDILANPSYVKEGSATTRLLDNLLVRPRGNSADLLIGDRNRLLITARISAYGAGYTARVTCPACNSSVKNDFDLSSIGNLPGWTEEIGEIYGVERTGLGTFSLKTPVQGAALEIRLLTGHDERRLYDMDRMQRAKDLPPIGPKDQMLMSIKSVQGVEDRGKLRAYIDRCPAADSRFIKRVYQAVEPSVDMRQTFHCTVCHNEMEVLVPLGTEFFWPR